MTILIVDYHPTFRRFARRLLVRSGFTVDGEAVDWSSAFAAAERLRPDVILLDVMLPDGSGIDVALALADRAAPSTVILTSSRSAADFGAALERADGFLPKSEFSVAAFSSLLEGRAGA